MSFNYTCLPGVKLTATEKQLLENIDNFNYPLTSYANLADLHSRITVELSDKQKIRKFSYEITPSQRDAEINSIQKKIDEISKLIDQKRQEFDSAQGSERDKLCEQLGELDLERANLRDIYCVYKNATQETNGNYIVSGGNVILGEYISSSKKVILYINSFPKNSVNLLAIVYVHEMMHAYLDCGGITLSKIEEPIVEYAMLNFFNAFDNSIDKSICFEAEKHVKEKQQVLGIAHYGFGYCIFKNPNGINWLEDYRNVKNSLDEKDPDVAAYLDYWKTGMYPEEKEKDCLEALYKALHHGSIKVMKVQSASKIEQSKNKIDLIRKLDDYLAKHSPIAPLGNAVIPSEHENRLYRGWKDSSARQYFDWLDPNKHSELIPLLNKHGLYGSIYNCVDLQQIANIYKELVDKTKPEAIAAYGNSENMVSAIRHFIEHLLEINHIIL